MAATKLRNDFIYEDKSFNEINAAEIKITGTRFVDCTFSHCNFSSAVFQECTFNRCTFTNSDLSLIQVHRSTFSKIEFRNSKLLGVDWTTASWHNRSASQLSRSVDFEECVLNYSSFFGLELPKAKFTHCIIFEVNFSESTLKCADFSGADLKGSLFRKTNLENANFIGAKNYQIAPTDNTITHATFSLPEAFSLLECLDINIE